MSHFLASPKEYFEQEICRDDPQSVTVQVIGEWKFIGGPLFHMKLMLIRDMMYEVCHGLLKSRYQM